MASFRTFPAYCIAERAKVNARDTDHIIIDAGIHPNTDSFGVVQFAPQSSSPSYASLLYPTGAYVQNLDASSQSTHSSSPPSSPPSRHLRGDPDRVRRPRNCFMMFRSMFVKIHKGESSQTELSRRAALEWNNMTEEEHLRYKEMSAHEVQMHNLQHPSYKFTPKQKKKRSKVKPASAKKKSRVISALPAPEVVDYSTASTAVKPLAAMPTLYPAFLEPPTANVEGSENWDPTYPFDATHIQTFDISEALNFPFATDLTPFLDFPSAQYAVTPATFTPNVVDPYAVNQYVDHLSSDFPTDSPFDYLDFLSLMNSEFDTYQSDQFMGQSFPF